MKHLIAIILSVFAVVLCYSQENIAKDTTQRIATIEHKFEGNQVKFTPNAPELNQIAGAPKAFYTNYWEFGDGTYSKENNPTKTYKKPGEYEVRLWATNNYDTGKTPTSRPKKIKVTNVDKSYNEEASMTTNFDLQRNREPVPEEEFVIIVKYKNTKDYVTNGKVFLFYNEKQFKADNFEISESRMYHNENEISTEDLVFTSKLDTDNYYASAENKILKLQSKLQDSTEKQNLPLTLEESKAKYNNSTAFTFKNMQPNEERNVFYTIKTTPEMIKDTSAIVSVRGIYVPDENYDNHNVKDMEMEIVTSHDPNKMSTSAFLMNYRLVRYKKPKFKIKFQNNGEGPARTIRLETDIPEIFDKSTIEVLDMYPKVKICPKYDVEYSCLDTTYTQKQAIFTFKNIYLPGSEQKNVKEYDSTKGFVKYRIKFGKNFHKIKTKSRTAIIFDKNEPIITNYSTTRFMPGISIGAKAGYNYFFDLDNSKSYFVGATLSPYKSYRFYWQVELLNSLHEFDGSTQISEQFTDNGATGELLFRRTTTSTSYNNIDWEVPVLLRYNVNNYIGLGAGLQGMISVSQKESTTTTIEDYENINTVPGALISSETISTENKASFTNFRSGFLVEATAGFARIGPSIGARYIFNFKDNYNYMQFYAIWKF
ncbi:PKD domain-containing protein [Mesoflavibacter sp.]|uniref:PKD domain-containing protein n=1 Tax=Mesoflavibacter sp. TaxID=1930902 RepID=UPI003516EC2B